MDYLQRYIFKSSLRHALEYFFKCIIYQIYLTIIIIKKLKYDQVF